MSQEPREQRKQGQPPSEVASRTPIRFGPAVEHIFRHDLMGFTQVLSEVTAEYLLYGFCREARENQHFFILVQGSRFSGRVVAEVAINRLPAFPYYKFSDEPRLGVGGYRDRVTVLMTAQDYSFRYGNQDELLKALREVVVGQASAALRTLGEVAGPTMHREQQTWQPVFEEWQQAEALARPGVERRYPILASEEEARDLLQEMLLSRKFDRFLGPMKFRYRDARFFHCHMYLFGRGLEFLEAPALPQLPEAEPAPEAQDDAVPRMFTWADILGPPPKPEGEVRKKELPPALGDAIAGITGRQPQSMAVELSLDPQVRHREFSFLKSLAAVEAFWEERQAR